jgi:beta-galactosidase
MAISNIKTAIVALLFFTGVAVADLFHEQSSATSSITYSNRCLIVNGQPTWILAGEAEYWRIPRELWRDRLMRIKRAGYNTISSYFYWSVHEPVQEEWHFEDNLDIDAWLSLAKEVRLNVIARVGPYICAEVDFGGFPAWLPDIPNIKLRGSNPEYLKCVDTYYEKIFPIITKHQITNGGSVIMVQIENEHYPAGGAYETHLVDKAKSLGMVVPYIWSMETNSGDYDPGTFPSAGKPNFVTELWVGWIGKYGTPNATDNNTYIKNSWRMLAAGTGGVSEYMAIGGTNFGYTASPDQRVTSYDYGAQIGELGQLRPLYYSIKQAGLLAGTFSPLFANSTNGASEINTLPTALKSWVHTGSAGKAAVVMNNSTTTQTFQLTWKNKNITVPSVGSWSLEPSRFAHFLADVPITGNVTLDYSATGVLSWKKFGTKNFIVVYGSQGNSGGDIAFVYKTAPANEPASPWVWNSSSKRASLVFTYPTADSVHEVVLDDGAGQSINLLIMNSSMSDRTWVTDTCIVSGAEFLDENNLCQFTTAGGKAYVFSSGSPQIITKAPTLAQVDKSFSSGWSWIASPEISASYNDSTWKQSAKALYMAAYGWPNGYGWYRATYNASAAGNATLKIPFKQGDVFIFVNGAWVGTSTNQSIPLKQGANSLVILANTSMRDKVYMTYDFTPADNVKSGIWGDITINGSSVGPWRFRGGFEGVKESPMMGTISTDSWSSLLTRPWSTGTPTADHVPRLWRIDFNYTQPVNGVQTWILNGTVNTGTQGVVWINGHCLGRQLTNQPPLFVPECWLKANNTFIILTQEGGAPQGYSLQPVEYRSIAAPTTSMINPVQNKFVQSRTVNRNAKFIIAGNQNTLFSKTTALTGNVVLYDLQGHRIQKKGISQGVFIERQEK